MNSAYNTTTDSLRQMFLDDTAGESASEGRLQTQRLENGNVGLVHYGWALLAEMEPGTGIVTVYDGHAGELSQTTTRHINAISEAAESHETRFRALSSGTPYVAKPPESIKYAGRGNYIGAFKNPKSPQDMKAEADVIESIN